MTIKKIFLILFILILSTLSYSNEIVPYGLVGKHVGGQVGEYLGGVIGESVGGGTGKKVGSVVGSEVGSYLGDKLEDYGKSKPTEPVKECDNPYPYTATCVHERMD